MLSHTCNLRPKLSMPVKCCKLQLIDTPLSNYAPCLDFGSDHMSIPTNLSLFTSYSFLVQCYNS